VGKDETLLVTGATGFIGRIVLRRLAETGWRVRTLLKPAPRSPHLPAGVPVEVALAALSDERGLRAALVGVRAVIHLAGAERTGDEFALQATDVEGTRLLAQAAAEAGVERMLSISHLGASRSSAFPVLRAKAEAEDHVRAAGVPYTILRSGVVFGAEDHFTTSLAMLLAASPLVFLMPGDGKTLLQPLWVEDLATVIAWALEDDRTSGHTYEIGGPEFLSFVQIVQMIMPAAGVTRILIPTRQPFLHAGARLMRRLLPRPPITPFWLDYLATNRTAELSSVPRHFGLQPSRLEAHLDHLVGRNWEWELLGWQLRGRRRER
jgi:NADH dehydrogenase